MIQVKGSSTLSHVSWGAPPGPAQKPFKGPATSQLLFTASTAALHANKCSAQGKHEQDANLVNPYLKLLDRAM